MLKVCGLYTHAEITPVDIIRVIFLTKLLRSHRGHHTTVFTVSSKTCNNRMNISPKIMDESSMSTYEANRDNSKPESGCEEV